MSQRTFASTPLVENGSHLIHHSPSSGLLNRSNTASRPGSPSAASGSISMAQQHHQHIVSGMSAHVSNGSSSSLLGSGSHDNSSGAGPGASIGSSGIVSSSISTSSKNDSYFPPLSSSSQMDHSLSVGNSGYSKRSRFGVGNALSSAKRSRWWNYTAAMLLAFALIEAMILLIGSSALYSMPDQIQIDSRDFRKVNYQGLELDPDATYKKSIQVYHVAKEFGVASMGGLGMVVTALASAQQRARTQKVNVVLPYYSMLDKVPGIAIKHHISLSLDVQDNRKRTQSIIFNIYKYKHEVPFKASDYENNRRAINPVAVWLIGPGDTYPFDRAFQSKDSQGIYSSPKGLPNEWKDLYFAKAVATFIQHQNRNSDISLFATAATRYIDIVHVHGATNALVLHYLQQSIERGAMGEEPPALIYTLHDYLDELQYSNEIANIQKFMDKRVHSDDDDEDMFLQMDGISPYCHGHRMFTSAMGIDLADAVTFVSKTLAKDIVEGRLDFYLKELVLGSVLNQAEKNLFIGITNGVDFGKLNPWTMPELRKHDLTFPPKDLMDQEEETESPQGIDGVDDVAKIPTGMGSPNPTIRAAKEAAKHYLYTKGLLTEQDLSRPLVLFIGRFQYNKGVGFFSTACKEIKERGGKFIIMGQPNNFPLKSILNLERLFKGVVKVISDPKAQDDWGVYWRAAADFLLVPSVTESFGLVAAEGLLFGSTVISSGVGGLSEFLVDRPNPNDKRQQLSQETDRDRQFASIERHLTAAEREEQFNSYLFDAFATDAHSQLTTAISDALSKWKQLQRNADEDEEFLTRLVTSALSMGWDRAGGPVDQYRALYEIALNAIDFGQSS